MTIEMWRIVLADYARKGNPNEQRMAQMLLELIDLEDWKIEEVFDRHASDILEAQS